MLLGLSSGTRMLVRGRPKVTSKAVTPKPNPTAWQGTSRERFRGENQPTRQLRFFFAAQFAFSSGSTEVLSQVSLFLRSRSGLFGQPSKTSNGLHEGVVRAHRWQLRHRCQLRFFFAAQFAFSSGVTECAGQLSLVLRSRSGLFGQPSKSSNGLHEGVVRLSRSSRLRSAAVVCFHSLA